MPIINSEFQTAFHLRHRHFQTLWPSLMRKPAMPKRSQILLNLSDGDMLELELVKPEQTSNHEAVLLIHGLTGSADSQYIVGLQNLFKNHGIMSIAMNFRGAKAPNFLAKGYHSGSSDDLAELAKHLAESFADFHWHAMGFSLGGNVLLKYLGEHPNNLFHSAVAVSVPLSLDVCASKLDEGFSRIYRNHLLKQLGMYLQKKHVHLSQVNPEQARLLASTPITKNFKSFWELDHEVIAPIHGFDSAKDYYARCSSRQFLKLIRTPTHIVNAPEFTLQLHG